MISENDVPKSGIIDFDIYPLKDGLEGELAGANAQGLLVLALRDEKDAQESLLRKILSAVRIDLDRDTAYLLLTTKVFFSSSSLLKSSAAKLVFLFGLSPAQCGLNLLLQPFVPLEHNCITFLAAPSLSEIAQNQSHKKQLWTAMQRLFPSSDT